MIQLEARVDEGGNLGRRAGANAGDASARVDEVQARLRLLSANRDARRRVKTIDIQFGFDRADLSDGDQTTLAVPVRDPAENRRSPWTSTATRARLGAARYTM